MTPTINVHPPPRNKAAVEWNWPLTSPSTKVKNERSNTSAHPTHLQSMLMGNLAHALHKPTNGIYMESLESEPLFPHHIILPSNPRSTKWFFSSHFLTTLSHTSHYPVRHILQPPHHSWFGYPNTNCSRLAMFGQDRYDVQLRMFSLHALCKE